MFPVRYSWFRFRFKLWARRNGWELKIRLRNFNRIELLCIYLDSDFKCENRLRTGFTTSRQPRPNVVRGSESTFSLRTEKRWTYVFCMYKDDSSCFVEISCLRRAYRCSVTSGPKREPEISRYPRGNVCNRIFRTQRGCNTFNYGSSSTTAKVSVFSHGRASSDIWISCK